MQCNIMPVKTCNLNENLWQSHNRDDELIYYILDIPSQTHIDNRSGIAEMSCCGTVLPALSYC